MTSHDVVNIVRKKTGIKRVGHGGTLDPLAEGVLVIAVGRENTKQLDTFVKGDKEYVAEIKLGETSTTDDSEGEKTKLSYSGVLQGPKRSESSYMMVSPNLEEVKTALKQFTGIISQIPPIYSAVKLHGKPAYKSARQGGTLSLKPRSVEIKEIKLLEYNYPMLKLRVVTGPGVYIRSLARDLGEKLGTGAYLSGLIRTRVSNFKLEEAVKLEDLEKSII